MCKGHGLIPLVRVTARYRSTGVAVIYDLLPEGREVTGRSLGAPRVTGGYKEMSSVLADQQRPRM
jgi:hypothetical protein